MKPLVLLDLDGVVNPLGLDVDGRKIMHMGCFQWSVLPNFADIAVSMLAIADVWWASAHEELANEVNRTFGVPEFEVALWGDTDVASPVAGVWKLPKVVQIALSSPDRLVIWVDDEVAGVKYWLELNPVPNLVIIEINGDKGLTKQDLNEILAITDSFVV